MARETIIEEHREGVLQLTLNRPAQKNAFNSTMWHDFRDAFAEARESEDVRVVVVTGAGDAFTAGQDLGEMSSAAPGGGSGGDHPFGTALDELVAFDKPLIAAVNGVGVGFGLTLLLHCDYVYLARGARLRAPFITLGVVPEAAASYLLPALIGTRAAMDLFYESDFVSAERIVELGLGTHLCEAGTVVDEALAHAARLARKPLGSLRGTKRLVLATRSEQVRAARAREDDAFVGRVGSPENIEAIKAFFEKREPDFRGVPSHDRPRD